MTYRGRVKQGVVVLDGPEQLREGAIVRVEEVPAEKVVGQGLDRVAGKAVGLPADLAEKHDGYRRDGK